MWFHYYITIAAEIGQAVVDLKLDVKCESVLIHYQTSKNNLEVFTFLLMFSLSKKIRRIEIYPIGTEKLIEDNMALVLAKLTNLFPSCVSVGGIVVSVLHHNCSRNRSSCGRPEARSEM